MIRLQEYNRSIGRLVFYDSHVQQLDLVIREAKRVGIRIICALTNNWEAFGGKRYYIRSMYGTSVPEDDFFVRALPIVCVHTPAFKCWTHVFPITEGV